MLYKKIDLYKAYKLERKDDYKGYLYIYAETECHSGVYKNELYPAILVIPGGGYNHVSKREGEPIALFYLGMGFVSAYLDYTCNSEYPRQLIEAMLALKYLKEHSRKLRIRKDRIATIGFSAGGHLAGLLSTLKEDERSLIDTKSYRPDLCIMSYPVVSSDSLYSHKGSFEVLGMVDNTKVSIDKRIDTNTPPMFIWTTKEDESVPPINSILLRDALKIYGIENEFVLFEKGRHGLSTVDYRTNSVYQLDSSLEETSRWMNLSIEFLRDFDFIAK